MAATVVMKRRIPKPLWTGILRTENFRFFAEKIDSKMAVQKKGRWGETRETKAVEEGGGGDGLLVLFLLSGGSDSKRRGDGGECHDDDDDYGREKGREGGHA